MEQAIDNKSPRKRAGQRSKADIIEALAAYDRSGNMSTKDFAAKYQVSETTFYNWRKKYRPGNTLKDKPEGFIPVSVAGSQMVQQPEPVFAEYRGIIFYQRVEPAYLKALLK